ncbi:hypothetical protein D9758_012440 [Tetrapyrgos nigripes]|uniref:Chitin synthase export chaperone n=1 Tax=Tetrapyrgos nigripes TaxID=182062 RepID=A0A8H5CZV4_9AGAR|nr:hypothetical protein D9758_012440 [Tetrapyrgos nigripes]
MLVGYFVLITHIVLRVLGEYKPFALFLGSAVLFVLSQAAWFLLERVVCQHTNAKLDSFIATVLETASVVMLFWTWRSITEGEMGFCFILFWSESVFEHKHGSMWGLITSVH